MGTLHGPSWGVTPDVMHSNYLNSGRCSCHLPEETCPICPHLSGVHGHHNLEVPGGAGGGGRISFSPFGKALVVRVSAKHSQWRVKGCSHLVVSVAGIPGHPRASPGIPGHPWASLASGMVLK